MPSLVEIGSVVLEKKLDENVKSLQTDRRTDGQTDGQTDDGRRTTGDQKSSLELSAQVS